MVGILLLMGCVIWLWRQVTHADVRLDVDQKINLTPEQITAIKSIGEWEFLAVADEELVDTVRKGLLSDDHLVRIYYGTMRFGVNLHQVEPKWIEVSGDTVVVTLPKVGLLDRDFIDEARTKSFYETGKWSHQAREALYRKAYRQMIGHGVTRDNLQLARQNGEAQFRKMMAAMGYQDVVVQWQDDLSKGQHQ